MKKHAVVNDQLPAALTPVRAPQTSELPAGVLLRVELEAVEVGGLVRVRDLSSGGCFACELLESGPLAPSWNAGDRLLALSPAEGQPGVIVGRLGRMSAPGAAQREVVIQAAERISLRCGESSIQMSADGKVVVKGDDVLLRAKGTQRIRAANVAIN